MKGILVAAAALTALLSGPAFAEPKVAEPTATDVSQPAPAPTAKPTRYCFDTETTGSRISKRVCLTREQWAAEGVEVPVTR